MSASGILRSAKRRQSKLRSPLTSWIDRKHPLPARFYTPGHVDIPDDKWATWLGLEEVSPLHLADSLEWLGLKESRRITAQYLSDAGSLISGLSGAWLDGEEREWILEDLGAPPEPCLPIYIITTGDGNSEQAVYIGKSKTNSRFSGGHSAALKLHAPVYRRLRKRIYRCSIWFHDNRDYIALEWMEPESLALEFLDSIESQLIFKFKPPLNTLKKNNYCATKPVLLHIQNFSGRRFIDDTIISPY